MNEKQIAILIKISLLIFPALILIPLLKYETWPNGHDATTTMFCSWDIVKSLSENFHLPYAWQVANHEYNGNLFWLFYQPVSYFLLFVIHKIISLFGIHSIFITMKLSVYIAFLISELGVFLALQEILKESPVKNTASLFGALFYLFAPYRIIDLYSRNAYSELWMFSWMPFYFLGLYKLFIQKDKNGAFYLLITTPVLLLTHLTPAFFYITFLNLSFIIYIIAKKTFFNYINANIKIVALWIISTTGGVFVSLLYILPVIQHINFSIGDFTGFDRASLKHILEHIPWTYFMLDPQNFGEKWQAGQAFLLVFALMNFCLLFNKKMNHKKILWILNISLGLTLIFLFSTTAWKYTPTKLYSLQFPWRLFLIYSFILSIASGILISEYKPKLLILLALFSFHIYTGYRYLSYGGEDLINKYHDTESWSNEFYRIKYTTANGSISNDFLPKTTQPIYFNSEYQDQLNAYEESNNTFIENLTPGIDLISHKRSNNNFYYELFAEKPTFIVFRQFYYPLWQLYIDSKRSQSLYLTEGGHIGFEIPEGKHQVKLTIK